MIRFRRKAFGVDPVDHLGEATGRDSNTRSQHDGSRVAD
jgi:hypothetical protein